MNPSLELEKVIFETLEESHGTSVAEDLTAELHQSIRNWMDKNHIIFYQP